MGSDSTVSGKRLKPRSTAYRYIFAVAAPVATMGAAFLLYTYVAHNPVLWGLLAIMIVAWHVGFGPGVVAALVVITVSRLLFQPNAPLLPSGPELMRLGLFLAMNSLIAALSSARQRAEASLIKANAELDHRVESKTAELRAANESLLYGPPSSDQAEVVASETGQVPG